MTLDNDQEVIIVAPETSLSTSNLYSHHTLRSLCSGRGPDGEDQRPVSILSLTGLECETFSQSLSCSKTGREQEQKTPNPEQASESGTKPPDAAGRGYRGLR